MDVGGGTTDIAVINEGGVQGTKMFGIGGRAYTRSVERAMDVSFEKAEELKAEHEFGAKYPDMVSVYSVGPEDATNEDPKHEQAYSIEFCGGPHVQNTGVLSENGKKFKITKEEASSAGIRRIKAILS